MAADGGRWRRMTRPPRKPGYRHAMMTDEQRAELRRAIIAGPTDCPMTTAEAAVFMSMSESALRESDCPRADVAGMKYLKSVCVLYVKLRLSHELVA